MYWHCRKHIIYQGQAFAWPFSFAREPRSRIGTHMTQTQSKSRQQVEVAFGHAQSQFFARGAAVEEHDAIIQARDAKTLRLREARKAKEVADRAAATAALIAKRA
jgi:hypothetical protein